MLAVVEDDQRGGRPQPLEERGFAADVQRRDERVDDVVGGDRGLESRQPGPSGRPDATGRPDASGHDVVGEAQLAMCLQENLNKGIGVVSRLVATRGTLEILSHILLATESGRLKLSATNLEIGINYKVGAKIEKDGSITVPARLFLNLSLNFHLERLILT